MKPLCNLFLGGALLATTLYSGPSARAAGAAASPRPLAEAAASVEVPPGFRVTLFAGEPDVRQPIGMAFDERGRLWVAECHTYSDARVNFDLTQTDRVVILEDTDHDGRMDRRKLFWEGARQLTSVEVGFGGVWVLCAPQMLFIPDRNGDDVPDGAPEVVLDGWDAGPVRHNIVNGLKWGPDGWLYGRQGIQGASLVGPPGTPEAERTRVNAAIWRVHPVTRRFEVVCQGTTNPWGHDWDEHGELFFINTVIGHLWHGIPGAYFKRMYGEHPNPYLYELIDQHADHYHWDTGKTWMDSRTVTGLTDTLGGGHAHSGMLIYLGTNWPARFRNGVLTVNLHGHRLNHDRLERRGAGYTARHEPDPVRFRDPWFRGVELGYGPDGGVYVLDWSDTGECHENDADGVHRETGRIYKIIHGEPARVGGGDLRSASDAELVRLQFEANEWFVRQARRLLQERAASGRDLRAAHGELRARFEAETDVAKKLRALWALHVTGGADAAWLTARLNHPSDHVRAWAVRLLTGEGKSQAGLAWHLAAMASRETSALVRLHLASALQRLPVEQRHALAAALLKHGEDAQDPNQPLMVWYGVEPLVARDPAGVVPLALESRIPTVRRLIVRRLSAGMEKFAGPLEELLRRAAAAPEPVLLDTLQGVAEGLRGRRRAPKPGGWDAVEAAAGRSDHPPLKERLRELQVVFGDGRALEEVRQIARDTRADGETRRAALRQLIEARPPDLLSLLKELIRDRVTAGVAARGLTHLDDPEVPPLLIRHLNYLSGEDRAAAILGMAARASYASALLDALEEGKVPRAEVTALHARQMRSLAVPALDEKLGRVWGEVRATEAEKRRAIERWRAGLTPSALREADLPAGRALFQHMCASCHKLFGEGGALGPDLTGSGRMQIDYLLENLVDPNAVVPADFRMSVVELHDGRVLNGVIVARTERELTLQTPTERMVLPRSEWKAVQPSALSLMPEGLLDPLTQTQVRDLVAYLMSPRQVPLPKAAE